MSGHSKWATIKHAKGVADARRGQLFTKLAREIIIATRDGGSDPEMNFRLRLAIQKAKDNNVPSDNIERAIKRGSGEIEGAQFVEMTLEGYGPSGTAILVQAMSDNRNRTLQEVRNLFTRNNGSLGEPGSVAWQFDSKGVITIDTSEKNIDIEELSLQSIDAGADDITEETDCVTIYTELSELENVRKALADNGYEIASAEMAMVPKTTIELEEKAALQTLKLIDKLEQLDEVQNVSSNVDFSDEVIEKFQAGA